MNQVNQTARPTRIAAWDLLKLFAIFLVVYGHCMQHLLEVDTRYNPMFLWITSFHMPLFMTLSGLFARNSFRASFKDSWQAGPFALSVMEFDYICRYRYFRR